MEPVQSQFFGSTFREMSFTAYFLNTVACRCLRKNYLCNQWFLHLVSLDGGYAILSYDLGSLHLIDVPILHLGSRTE